MISSRLCRILASLVGLGCILASPATFAAPAGPGVEDVFGRDVSASGIILPDFDGYMANPAIEFRILPPAGAAFPVTATLTAREPRLSFNLPSKVDANGPSKEVTFANGDKLAVLAAIFPARQKRRLDFAIEIRFRDAQSRQWHATLPAHVLAFENEPRPATFPVTLDFSEDRSGFFGEEKHRAVLRQAAADWAYYLQDLKLDPVPKAAEKTFIWGPDGFKKTHLVANAAEYTGTLLYVYGISGEELRSGGEPSSAGGFHTRDGKELAIRRSGGVEVETRGNFNKSGWLVDLADDEWWKATNLREHGPSDLYSIVHHEMGHALFFNPANRNFPRGGVLKDDRLREYLGRDPTIDKTDHFDGTVDPWSLRGAFGFEYHGQMPLGRWLITRTDLLAAQAVGYRLRQTAALTPLSIETDKLPAGSTARGYDGVVRARGGIPFYDWQVSKGKLPANLVLDRFTGQITGQPTQEGRFEFTVRVRDYQKGSEGVSRALSIDVRRE